MAEAEKVRASRDSLAEKAKRANAIVSSLDNEKMKWTASIHDLEEEEGTFEGLSSIVAVAFCFSSEYVMEQR